MAKLLTVLIIFVASVIQLPQLLSECSDWAPVSLPPSRPEVSEVHSLYAIDPFSLISTDVCTICTIYILITITTKQSNYEKRRGEQEKNVDDHHHAGFIGQCRS